MKEYYPKFESGKFYHVYNRANGKEILFKEPKNYNFFLEKWNDYLNPFLDVWTYCLLPNHFHFLVKIKNLNKLELVEEPGKLAAETISNQFRSLFISYTKSFNKVYDRHGNLFQKPFKRLLVDSNTYLLTLIHYIHHNPIHHSFVNDFSDWKYSSYSALTGKGKTNVKKSAVLNLYGGRKEFIDFHNQMKDYKKIKNLIIE
ncbi:MAG: hypothetical protein U5J95_11810 [Balneolaceae bacterium]|nr:hypothetical protein [Balneolaceae bacterium]